MTIKQTPASTMNFGVGRNGLKVNKIILHWADGTLSATDSHFANPASKVSAHYGIGQTEIHQYVNESDTAWHSGNLTVNRESIGIEHEGGPTIVVTESVINQSIELCTDICKRYSLPADKDHIKRHSDIKATQCPGTLPVERIIDEVAKRLKPVETLTDDQRRALDFISSKKGSDSFEGAVRAWAGASADKPDLESKAARLKALIDNINQTWNLPTDSDEAEILTEAKRFLKVEDVRQEYRDSIEGCVGTFPSDEALLDAHSAVRKQIDILTTEVSDLQKKLEESKTPVGYKFVGSWDFFSHRYKHYKKGVT